MRTGPAASALQESSRGSAAALTQSHEMSAQRLLRRYRKLLWLTVAPVFALLALFAQWQGASQYQRALDSAAADARAHGAAIDAAVASVTDHVLDMQRRAHKDLALGEAITPADRVLTAAVRTRAGDATAADGHTLDSLPELVRREVAQLLWADAAAPTPQALGMLQSLSIVMELAHLRNPDLAGSYLFGWPQPHVALFPWLPSRDVAQARGQPTLRAALDAWYAQEHFRSGTPERNSARLPYWTAPYVDADGRGLVVSRAAPLYHGGEFRGVVGADLKLSALERLLDRLPREPWRAWIVDDAGHVVADRTLPLAEPAVGVLRDGARTPRDSAAPSRDTAASADATPPDAAKSARGAAGSATPAVARAPLLEQRLPHGVAGADIAAAAAAQGRPHAVAGHQMLALRTPGSPWTLVLLAPTRALWLGVLPLVLPYLLIAVALLLVVLIGQSMLQWRIIVPALRVMGYLQHIAQDDAAAEPKLGPRWQPWVTTITQTFASLRESLQRERRSEAFKSAVVDHALAAIVTTDADGHVVEWNPAAQAMFGVPRERALGADVKALIVPARHRAGFGAGTHWLKPGNEHSIIDKRVELSGLRADGSEFPVDVVVSRIEVDGARHFCAFVNDVSERREAARQIEDQREALRQSEKLTAMGSLLAGVAHELNNPLAIVLGRASLLEEKCENAPGLKADAMRIREAAERCGRIVRTFLNMARSKPAQRTPVSLNDLARAAADMLGYTLRSHAVDLQL
ncbi:MAG: PAS domain S-box protein, partial [Burkholderiaceae bacterium]